jgi:predicted acyltransferase
MAFVMPRLEAAGDKAFLKKVFTRALLIFGIGLFLNWFPFIKWSGDSLVAKNWVDPVKPDSLPTGIRTLGVLQRIALAYCFASLIIYYGKIRAAFVTGAVILLGYWLVCLLAGAPGDPYSLNGYFGTSIDKAIIGPAHMYKGEGIVFDPEGLASLLPAVVQVILGYMVGNYIATKGKTYEMITNLFVVGAVFMFIGEAWGLVFPINKKIWTSSFVLYTTGVATLTLCVLMYIIEMKERRASWTRFFDVFGKNALFIFLISGIIPRLYGLIRINDGVNAKGETIKKPSAAGCTTTSSPPHSAL